MDSTCISPDTAIVFIATHGSYEEVSENKYSSFTIPFNKNNILESVYKINAVSPGVCSFPNPDYLDRAGVILKDLLSSHFTRKLSPEELSNFISEGFKSRDSSLYRANQYQNEVTKRSNEFVNNYKQHVTTNLDRKIYLNRKDKTWNIAKLDKTNNTPIIDKIFSIEKNVYKNVDYKKKLYYDKIVLLYKEYDQKENNYKVKEINLLEEIYKEDNGWCSVALSSLIEFIMNKDTIKNLIIVDYSCSVPYKNYSQREICRISRSKEQICRFNPNAIKLNKRCQVSKKRKIDPNSDSIGKFFGGRKRKYKRTRKSKLKSKRKRVKQTKRRKNSLSKKQYNNYIIK